MYIPRDEIFAYCANTVFEKMYEEWDNMALLNQENIDQQLCDKGLDSLDNIFKFVRRKMNSVIKTNYRIDQGHTSYPVITKILGLGKTKNTDATMTEAADRARKINRSLSTPATMDAIINAVSDEILTIVKGYFDLYGPFYAIAMMSGLRSRQIRGFVDRISEFKQDIPEKTKSLKNRMEQAKRQMQEEGVKRVKDLTPTIEETEDFVTVCETYTKACVDVYLIQKMADILDKIYNKLNEANSETYQIYTTTIEVLGALLHQDSIFATDTERVVNCKGETFYFDAIGFKKSAAMRSKFLELFKDAIDDAHVKLLAEKFKDNMFSSNTVNIWKNAGEDKEAFAHNIRSMFQEFFSEYTTDTLEKFLVLANSNEQGLTPARLTQIWEATAASSPEDLELRNKLIDEAADSIYRELSGSSAIMMRSNISQTHVNHFPSTSLICLISSMPKLNAAMKKLHSNASYTEVDRDFKSTITMFEMRSGITAATITGMNEYAQEYFNSEKTPATYIGRHMDEGEQKWDYYLPEIYGIDADDFYAVDKKVVPRLTIKDPENFRDLVLMQRIRDCVKAGLDAGWICPDNVNYIRYYCIYRVKQVKDEYNTFKKILREKLLDGSFTDIWEIAGANYSGIVLDEIPILPSDDSDNDLDVLQIPTNDVSFVDIHRVIRKSIPLMESLFKTYDEYKDADNIIGIYNKVKAEVEQERVEMDRMATFNNYHAK